MSLLNPEALDRWRAMYAASERATPFQSPSWLLPLYTRHISGDPEPLFTENGFFPLTRTKVGPFAQLNLAGADYGDIVCAAGSEEIAVREFVATLHKRRDWRFLQFRCLGEKSALLEGWKAAAPSDMAWRIVQYRSQKQISLPATWAEYEKQIGKKLAYKLRAAAGRREREFASSELRRATESTLDEDLEALFSLHEARWKARGLPGVFSTVADRAAFRTASKSLLANRSLRLYSLWLDGKPAAALCCLADRQTVYYYNSGIDTSYTKHNPGGVMIAMAVRDAIELGQSRFDFLAGDEPYKDRWANSEVPIYCLVAGRGLLGTVYVSAVGRIVEMRRARTRLATASTILETERPRGNDDDAGG